MKTSKLLFFLVILLATFYKAQKREIVTSDGVKLYVNVKGKGTPCLYLHGGPGSGSYWLEKFYGSELEKNFQMIYLDQRGVSRSSSPADKNYSLDRMLQDFEEVRNALGIKEWLTIGHSFGGILQMAYVEKYPQSIKGMMMVNCTLSMKDSFCNSWIPKASELAGEKMNPLQENTSPEILLKKMMEVGKKMDDEKVRWKMAFASPESDNLMNSSYREITNWNNSFSNVALSIEDYWKDFRKDAGNVKVPVLFFYGKSDWMVGPDHYKKIKFPKMMLWRSDVGHMPFLENQKDLDKAIKAYVKKYKLQKK
ncbi:alpha/beta fold hydrolase [Epilithonimonas hungarica]|uniref:Proline iminopeptidase n=1 Tax=Epilithonimonas hungarica TaxID=454006 RepID=A0A1G7SL74_9FLAO|nr:alpha/beta hydrolase [Epilithonimonas hungarica]SDG23815.1 proline iminopeptidase [Epilithonimonas hungarica]